MKKLLKNVLYFILTFFEHKGVVVLMYHSVGENREFFTVPEKGFERQMKYLSKNKFNVISVEQLVEILEKNLAIPRKTVVITFDDGYEDNFLAALPILKKFDFPATIFVSTANIGKTIQARNGSKLKIMSADQIKEMEDSGLISIGSHSNEHIKLPSLNSEQISKQLSLSQSTLVGIFGKEAQYLAYPSGKVNADVREVASKYFRAGFGVQKGRVALGDDMMCIKRNSVDATVSFPQFKGIAVFGRI